MEEQGEARKRSKGKQASSSKIKHSVVNFNKKEQKEQREQKGREKVIGKNVKNFGQNVCKSIKVFGQNLIFL